MPRLAPPKADPQQHELNEDHVGDDARPQPVFTATMDLRCPSASSRIDDNREMHVCQVDFRCGQQELCAVALIDRDFLVGGRMLEAELHHRRRSSDLNA